MHLKQNFNIVFCSGLFYNRVSRACKSSLEKRIVYEVEKICNRHICHGSGVRQLAPELPIYGGFYSGSDAYYIVTGQKNEEESDTVECYRITKYDKNWNRIGSAGLYDCNTFLPFRAGCVRMTEADGSQISPVYTMNGMLSDCESVYISDTVVWYTSDSDGNVTFYGVDSNGNALGSLNGLIYDGDNWVYYRNDNPDYGYTGLAANEYGWWYMTNGALDLTYNGTADNEYGTWNVVNGHVEV